ncbi:hypothetical protein AGLY_018174 [Aphis glycines]|uniref:DUF659 domain-containing protein n=1 Tax=Aphis glycines TaxID=307491 RepID=A0A6G0STL3_APHGL|nr:hypothetical protein AGLY_018174 [Aphis glycines]
MVFENQCFFPGTAEKKKFEGENLSENFTITAVWYSGEKKSLSGKIPLKILQSPQSKVRRTYKCIGTIVLTCTSKFLIFRLVFKTTKTIPNESTLREGYFDSYYTNTIPKIRDAVNGKKMWVCIDDTIDNVRRNVANVIIGILKPQGVGKTYLVHTEYLDKVNHSTIFQYCLTNLCIFYGQIMLITRTFCYLFRTPRRV